MQGKLPPPIAEECGKNTVAGLRVNKVQASNKYSIQKSEI